MEKIKFYSESDLLYGRNLDWIVDIIKNYSEATQFHFNDLLVFYNILKYLNIEIYKNFIEEKTSIKTKEFAVALNRRIGSYINDNKEEFLDFYDITDFTYTEDYFEIMEKYKVYKDISMEKMLEFLLKERRALHQTLKRKGLVIYYDEIIKDSILVDPINAELVLDKYLSRETLFLPLSLTGYEIEELLDRYLNLDELNINQLGKIIYLPSRFDLKISDKLRLKAKRRQKQEEEKFFDGNGGIEFGANIAYVDDQNEAVIINGEGTIVSYSIHKKWITDNNDFNTLLNNFIYIFKFFDYQCRLRLVSRKNEVGVFERIASHFWDYSYENHSAFKSNEIVSTVQLVSYSKFLSLHGISLEDIIEWFFHTYIQDEFGINDFVVKMPSDVLSFLEKCKTILPEVDRILKQYDIFVTEGNIDCELLQMSSKPLKFRDCISKVEGKYIYPNTENEYYNNATYSFFSDQSNLFYLPKFNEQYSNLFGLIQKEQVRFSDFAQYQKQGIQWLLDCGLLIEDDSGYIILNNKVEINILGDLYMNEVISYWRQPLLYRRKLDELIEKGILIFESSLFSKKEQDYFDYYLNRTKFTNGEELRNNYIHGTHSNEKQQHERDYYTILKILIMIIIKINDDLCLFEDNKKE